MGSKPSLLSSIDNLKRLFDSVPFRKWARLVYYYSTLFEKGDDAYFFQTDTWVKAKLFLETWFIGFQLALTYWVRGESISPNLNLGRHKKYFSQIAVFIMCFIAKLKEEYK